MTFSSKLVFFTYDVSAQVSVMHC